MKYRKKPVVVKAIRWTGDNTDEVIEFGKMSVMTFDSKLTYEKVGE